MRIIKLELELECPDSFAQSGYFNMGWPVELQPFGAVLMEQIDKLAEQGVTLIPPFRILSSFPGAHNHPPSDSEIFEGLAALLKKDKHLEMFSRQQLVDWLHYCIKHPDKNGRDLAAMRAEYSDVRAQLDRLQEENYYLKKRNRTLKRRAGW